MDYEGKRYLITIEHPGNVLEITHQGDDILIAAYIDNPTESIQIEVALFKELIRMKKARLIKK